MDKVHIDVGMVVKLKSGSPRMVVTEVSKSSDGRKVKAMWFSGNYVGSGLSTNSIPFVAHIFDECVLEVIPNKSKFEDKGCYADSCCEEEY